MKKMTIPLIFVGIIWIVFLIMGQKAIQYGIYPRNLEHWQGIFFAPFIHANLNHILSNTLPVFLLMWLMALFYERFWLIVTILITLTGDILLWLIGRGNSVHVGASLMIFGLIGFFLASAVFRKEFKAFFVALIVGALYGGALIGILPTNPYISWEGHLSGFLAGILWAYIFRNIEEKRKEKSIISDTELSIEE